MLKSYICFHFGVCSPSVKEERGIHITTLLPSKRLVVQSLSHIQLFRTPWNTACQASLSFTIPQNLLKLISIELVMPSRHLILCHPLLLLPSIFPSIKVFTNELSLHIRQPKDGASASVLPMNIQGNIQG